MPGSAVCDSWVCSVRHLGLQCVTPGSAVCDAWVCSVDAWVCSVRLLDLRCVMHGSAVCSALLAPGRTSTILVYPTTMLKLRLGAYSRLCAVSSDYVLDGYSDPETYCGLSTWMAIGALLLVHITLLFIITSRNISIVHVYIHKYPYFIHVMMRHFHNPGFSHQLSQSYYVTKLSHGSGIILSRRWLLLWQRGINWVLRAGISKTTSHVIVLLIVFICFSHIVDYIQYLLNLAGQPRPPASSKNQEILNLGLAWTKSQS